MMPARRISLLRLLPYAIVIGAMIVGVVLVLLLERPAGPGAAVDDPRLIARVEAAVRATFPRLCPQPNFRVIIEPSLTDPRAGSWNIHCNPNPTYLPKDTPMLTINTLTCDVKGTSSLTLTEDFPELFNTPRLANCPLQ